MTDMGISDGRMAKAGDVYTRHADDLVRFATVLVGPDDANDVVSSAVLRVLERDLEEIENPRAYLFRAVTNEARNLRRGESRRRAREDQSHLNPMSYP